MAGVGLLGRRVGGPAVGLLGAALAALYPLLIVADGALLSETLFGPIVAFTLLAAWRLGEEPTVRWAALVGLGIGLAALTRSEALLLLPLLALPLAWRGGGGRARWLRLGSRRVRGGSDRAVGGAQLDRLRSSAHVHQRGHDDRVDQL